MEGRLPNGTKGLLYAVTGILLMGFGYNCTDSSSESKLHSENRYESGYKKGRDEGLKSGGIKSRIISASTFEYGGMNAIKMNSINGVSYMVRRVGPHYTPANDSEIERIESGIENWVERE